MSKQLNATHRLRFVLHTGGLIFVSILDRPSPVSFLSQPAYFRRITGISPLKTIGTVRVTEAQLRLLGFIPQKGGVAI
ncbi:hypothetical protein [Paenibacillus sp. Leaf72]|uniref:hypothetical protein n=1 Tax=Paenibacillus sp. Leaf72 TaxID=1736234 RepID=UPI0006F83760|nr:hypothetical protein [Paenibacillus sp. Leaf72]KQN97599.1 hypothetical protein ASF12_20515 [Paenibacillus sp. Leaf72]